MRGEGPSLLAEQAEAIFDVLVKHCGEREDERSYFVGQQVREFIPEFRFQGSLGFGGKFWRNGGKWYVNCYREDETPDRRAAIDAANEELAELYRSMN